MLRSHFSLIYIFVGLFFIVVDSYNNIRVFIPWYILLMLSGVVCLILNRLRYYDLVNGLIIILSNVFVFLFADSDDPYGGVFFYFTGTGLTALILFSYTKRIWGITGVLCSLGLGLLAFTTDFNFIPTPVYLDDSVIKISFLYNFILGTVTCSSIVYFLIKENHQSENELQKQKQQLVQTTEELSRSKEQLEMAVKGTRAGIYEWNIKENSIYVTPEWRALLGFNDIDLPAITVDTFISFVHPEDSERTSQKIQEVLKTHQPYQNELRVRTKSGNYKWFLDSGIVKTDKDKNPYFVIGSLIDIDDRKKTEKEIFSKNIQLAKTNEELDRFVYSASHDMRAPLSSLLGLIHLSEKTNEIEDLRTYNAMMKDRIKVMEGFIKEVTDYSRNTRLDLSLTSLSLAALANEVVNNLAYSHVNKKMRVEVAIDPTLSIVTDASRVKVIFNNLISNAYKYQQLDGENPYILIKARQAETEVLIQVEDNGRGISEEHHHRIFDMFYRASENSEGSGLGLYIVKETLEKLGGDISVQSELGVGSTFTFSLPNLV
jgi:PAS domain S-box-containing protein